MSLKNKLNRLKPHISLEEKKPLPSNEVIEKIKIPFSEQWEKEKVFPYYFDHQYCLVREIKYPITYKHGHYFFSDFLDAVHIWNEGPQNHPLSASGHKAEELFFFDTETTGLGGGVGNTIFLLGYASIVHNELVLRQHLLPHPGAEVPLYQSFLERVNYKTLVTYNGKSFDWPQVKTRHTLIREHVPKLPSFGHFDLYHASRRLWKHRLDRLKLSVVEKEILGVERVDDIPGFLAPMIYFDFIENNDPEGIIGVLKHNEVDILSLVTLYTHLTFQLCGRDPSQTRKESFEVGRWYASIGEDAEAGQIFSSLIDGRDQTSNSAKFSLALQLKKENAIKKALVLFEKVANEKNELSFLACIEAAKILEHKYKNFEGAIKYCNIAMDLMDTIDSKKQNELIKRVIRLKQKHCKFPG
ncbi:MAG: ribonuclease H-like domain-containing protein [Bacillota bacterium]|nr:ribonuclease H-like domain-containing protein [Bacillota bacterium]